MGLKQALYIPTPTESNQTACGSNNKTKKTCGAGSRSVHLHFYQSPPLEPGLGFSLGLRRQVSTQNHKTTSKIWLKSDRKATVWLSDEVGEGAQLISTQIHSCKFLTTREVLVWPPTLWPSSYGWLSRLLRVCKSCWKVGGGESWRHLAPYLIASDQSTW